MTWLETPLAIIVFLTIVTILVAAHEFGHYLFARLFKMEVEEFAIGFGRPVLFVWKRVKQVFPNGKTAVADFTVRPLPIGGFVRITGMTPEEDGSETKVENGFYSKPPLARLAVLFAGPLFSIVAGVITIASVVYAIGDGRIDGTKIGEVVPNTPAMSAGLRTGDRILSLDNNPVSDWVAMTSYVRARANKPIQVRYSRNGPEATVTVVPQESAQPEPVIDAKGNPTGAKAKIGLLGIKPSVVFDRVSAGEALRRAASFPVIMATRLLGTIFTKPSTLQQEVGGPITMYAATKATMKLGIPETINLAGLLSISLGIINLFPIPMFDGGQMVVAFVELLRRGKRLSYSFQVGLANFGAVLVVMLIAGVFFIDIKRFFLPQ